MQSFQKPKSSLKKFSPSIYLAEKEKFFCSKNKSNEAKFQKLKLFFLGKLWGKSNQMGEVLIGFFLFICGFFTFCKTIVQRVWLLLLWIRIHRSSRVLGSFADLLCPCILRRATLIVSWRVALWLLSLLLGTKIKRLKIELKSNFYSHLIGHFNYMGHISAVKNFQAGEDFMQRKLWFKLPSFVVVVHLKWRNSKSNFELYSSVTFTFHAIFGSKITICPGFL